MTSQQATGDTSEETFSDVTSQQAPVGTNATHSDSGALPAQQTGGNGDAAYEQAPLGGTGNTSEARGTNTQDEAVGSKVNNQGAVVDDSFDTQVKSTKDKVVGGFQKTFSTPDKTTNTTNQGVDDDSLETQLRNTKAKILGAPQVSGQEVHGALNPTRPRGGINSGDDDSFETQVRNTGAQVVGTVQGIGSSLKLAGEKIKGSFAEVKDSPKKT